jgi:glycosyltransferase involved in cell wall biosynthesis
MIFDIRAGLDMQIAVPRQERASNGTDQKMRGIGTLSRSLEEGAVAISVVVPVYKEEGNIQPFLARIVPVLERIGSYEILFCLDPSPDRSEELIEEQIRKNPSLGLLVMSRRFGQPAATMAGILNCRGDACVVIDVDLQDPPELILDMYAKILEGYDVVYAKRRSRGGETLLKRAISNLGYKLINAISEVRIPRNTGDFRIITRGVIEELRGLPESHGFLRGLVALVGYQQTAIEYDRDPRLAGTGNYNRYLGSLKIAFNGLFGFSTAPLQVSLWTGVSIAVISVFLILFIFFTKLVLGKNYPLGIPTITVLVLFTGGVQLISLGIIGEYIGRIYDEVRRRPHYIVMRAHNVAVRDRRGPNSGNEQRALAGDQLPAGLERSTERDNR